MMATKDLVLNQSIKTLMNSIRETTTTYKVSDVSKAVTKLNLVELDDYGFKRTRCSIHNGNATGL